jgi:hypothetical protein
MRVCVFVADLAGVASRKGGLLRDVAAVTGGQPADDVCFVGLRQTQPVGDGTPAYLPYVPPDDYFSTRVGNTILRLAGAGLMPQRAVESALSRCAPAFIEAILACDPDVVLLDVPWAQHLRARLEPEFPERVYVTGDREAVVHERPGAAASPRVPNVSIILPTYNGSKYLRQSIQSCLDQSHRNVELIVVDDGSRENIGAIVAEFNDRRLNYIRHDTNQGLPATLNTGFRHATGELLTWTSDDNYYAPDAIERMAGFLSRHPTIPFVYTSMHIIDETESGALSRFRTALPPATLERQNAVGACFLYTREVSREIGEYRTAAVLVEDYDYWVRVSKRFRMQRLFSRLYYYRHHAASLTSQHGLNAVAVRLDMVRQQNGVA